MVYINISASPPPLSSKPLDISEKCIAAWSVPRRLHRRELVVTVAQLLQPQSSLSPFTKARRTGDGALPAGRNPSVFVVSECVWPTAVWMLDTDDKCCVWPNGTNHSVQPVSLRRCTSPPLGEGESYVTEAEVTSDSCENVQNLPKCLTLYSIKACLGQRSAFSISSNVDWKHKMYSMTIQYAHFITAVNISQFPARHWDG